MKIGDKIPIVLQVVKPVENVGMPEYSGYGLLIENINIRGDKFWASPGGNPNGPFVMVCADGDTEAGAIKRKAIIDLIECGVGG